jgi:uncharacterized iron-regulated membrane protein
VSVQVETMQSALRFAMLPSRIGAAVILAVGLFMLYLGVWLWRRCRRRSRQARGLNMSPHLMKKHD